jgi:hypothetical protein
MQTNSENFWKTNVLNELKTKALEMSDDKLETTAPNCVQLLFFFEARQALASHNNDGLKKKDFSFFYFCSLSLCLSLYTRFLLFHGALAQKEIQVSCDLNFTNI